MRVLHIVTSLNPEAGGVSQAIRTMILGLKGAGVDNEVVSLDPPEASFLKSDSFKVTALGEGITAWHYNSSLQSWLEANLKRFDAAIVHGLWQYQSWAVYRAMKNLRHPGLRLFVMPHGMLDPYFQKAPGRKLKALRNWFFWKVVERKLIHRANALFFTCETEKLLARESFKPYNPRTEKVTGLGVERPPSYQETMKSAFSQRCGKTSRKYFLYISRIHEKKGVDLLIKAWLALKEEYPEIPDLVIAGPGLESEYGKQMQEMASVNNKIVFPGMITGDAKWGALYGCEAFILPSHQENFGIAVVEALACTKPVLISDQVNIWREIKTAGAGIVAEDNLEGTRALLKQWIEKSEDEKALIGYKAQDLYQSVFSVENATERLLQALNAQHRNL